MSIMPGEFRRLVVDEFGMFTLADDTEGMTSPYRCLRCGHVHDAGLVTVEQRYTDCSMWRCPRCDSLIDDRPSGGGWVGGTGRTMTDPEDIEEERRRAGYAARPLARTWGTDPAALTDEELARIRKLHDHAITKPLAQPDAFHRAAWQAVGECVPRLIAALRASRAEMGDIRVVVEECLREAPPSKMTTLEAVRTMARYVAAYRRNWGKCHERHMTAEAEVERLRREIRHCSGSCQLQPVEQSS